MIEQKLKVDRYFNLTNPTIASQRYEDGDFITQQTKRLTLEQSTGIINKKSNILTGQGAKAHRNFQWLAWFPGAINQVSQNGLDVLTGPMSGCWLVIYRLNGIVQIGHIGTDVASREKSTAVKQAWNKFSKDHPNDVIAGFNPVNGWVGTFPASKSKDNPAPKIFGLLTTKLDLFSVFTFPQKTNNNLLRVGGIQKISSAGLHKLQSL